MSACLNQITIEDTIQSVIAGMETFDFADFMESLAQSADFREQINALVGNN